MTLMKKISRANELIKESIRKYGKIGVGCSFGKDSMVLLHLCHRINPKIKVFCIMADTEFPETVDFADDIIRDWGLNCEIYDFKQENGFMDDLSICCRKPKVEATKLAVKDLDAWVSGIRNTEGVTRKEFKEVEKKGGLVKINPILEFTETDIWRYTALFGIPVNHKYIGGYRSLGCRFCSTKEKSCDTGERDGRWRNTSNQGGECNIHTKVLK